MTGLYNLVVFMLSAVSRLPMLFCDSLTSSVPHCLGMGPGGGFFRFVLCFTCGTFLFLFGISH